MFNSPTVFVVGAGASADLNLPLGATLRDQIAESLRRVEVDHFGQLKGPDQIIKAMRIRSADETGKISNSELNGYLHATRHIAANLPLVRSIDEFVDHHAGDTHIEFMAKIAICRQILNAERSSGLLTGPEHSRALNLDWMRQNDVWLLELWYLLREGARAGNPSSVFENASFIVFNYDRCLEEFLARALESLFQVQTGEAWDIVAHANIIHPYGAVSGPGHNGRAEFGQIERADLAAVAQGIRTFGETERDLKQMNRIRAALDEAANVIFLGFAFHDQNMDFFESDAITSFPATYATAMGLPEEHCNDIRHSLLQRWGRPTADPDSLKPIFRVCRGAELLRTFGKVIRR